MIQLAFVLTFLKGLRADTGLHHCRRV